MQFANKWMSPVLSSDGMVGSRFNGRHLTCPEDILGAFSGGFVFGHPDFWFGITLPWQPQYSSERRRIQTQWYKYRNLGQTDSGHIPHGRARHKYMPQEDNERGDDGLLNWLPSALPQFYHTQSPSCQERFWFPLPVLSSDGTTSRKSRMQYLYGLLRDNSGSSVWGAQISWYV